MSMVAFPADCKIRGLLRMEREWTANWPNPRRAERELTDDFFVHGPEKVYPGCLSRKLDVCNVVVDALEAYPIIYL